MSMSDHNVNCTGCDYGGVIEESPVRLDYMLPDGNIVHGYRTFAWCHTCDDITDAEDLPDAANLREQIRLLEMQKRTSRTFLGRLFNKAGAEPEEARQLQAKLSMAELRHSGPRCLQCGETTVVPLRFNADGLSNVVHRCGGRIFKVNVPDDPYAPMICYGLRVIKLDPDGRKIGEEVL
jgi:hypothetical protein